MAAAVKAGPFATSALDNDISGPGTKRNAAPAAILLVRAGNAQATAIGKPGATHCPYAVGLSRPAASMLLPEPTPGPLTSLAVERRNAFGAFRPGSPPGRYLAATAWANLHEGGLIMTGGHKAVGIEPNRILFGNVSGYRNVAGAPVGIPIREVATRRDGR